MKYAFAFIVALNQMRLPRLESQSLLLFILMYLKKTFLVIAILTGASGCRPFWFLPTEETSMTQTWTISVSDGRSFQDVVLKKLTRDTLYVLSSGIIPGAVCVDDIVSMRMKPERETNWVTGATLGALVGGVVGIVYLIGKRESRDPRERVVETAFEPGVLALFSGTGVLVGALIGSFSTSEGDLYDFAKMNRAEKLTAIDLIMLRSKNK